MLTHTSGLADVPFDVLKRQRPGYQKLLGKTRRAIGERREGDFVLSATVDRVTNGEIKATGAGLFLPVSAEGSARIVYRPAR